MSNMSYCRFENTAGDLDDCLSQLKNLLGEGDDRPEEIPAHHHQERAARVRLVELCLEVAELFEGAADDVDPARKIKAIIEAREAAWAAERDEECPDEDEDDEDDGDDEGEGEA